MTKERFIAFLDLLGFSDLILTNDLDDVLKKFEFSLMFKSWAESLGEWTSLKGRIYPGNRKCSCFSFSDTFVLCSRDTSAESLNTIITATFILTRGLFASISPVRGAITKGEADYIPNTDHLIGKAIINAARLEKQQNWCGVIISPEVLSINNKKDSLYDSTSQVIAEYPVPFKDGKEIPSLVINWRLNLIVKHGIRSLLQIPSSSSTAEKIDNTLKFAKYIRNTGQAYKKLREKWQQNLFIADTDPTMIPPKHGDEY